MDVDRQIELLTAGAVDVISEPELRTKLRISVGRPDQNNRLLAALRKALAPR